MDKLNIGPGNLLQMYGTQCIRVGWNLIVRDTSLRESHVKNGIEGIQIGQKSLETIQGGEETPKGSKARKETGSERTRLQLLSTPWPSPSWRSQRTIYVR